jgi:hypothetical protein
MWPPVNSTGCMGLKRKADQWLAPLAPGCRQPWKPSCGGPIVTARGMAATLGVSLQAALGLIGRLCQAGIVREATGRASWRAFVTARSRP